MKLFFFILSFLICSTGKPISITAFGAVGMKTFFLMLFIMAFVSCQPLATEDKGDVGSLPVTVDYGVEINKLKVIISFLVKDTVYKAKQITDQAKQILALKKNDSIYNLKVNSEAAKQKDLIYRVSVDSINQWKKINLVYPLVSIFPKDSLKQWQAINSATALIQKVSFLTTRFTGDSVKQWNTIKTVTPLIPKVASLKTDSAKQWVEINKLKSASPVTQIPVLQADIKAIQSKNVSQDKVIVAHTSSIKNIEDTLNVYKRVASSDFGVDARGYFKISQAGMERIKINTQPQP